MSHCRKCGSNRTRKHKSTGYHYCNHCGMYAVPVAIEHSPAFATYLESAKCQEITIPDLTQTIELKTYPLQSEELSLDLFPPQ